MNLIAKNLNNVFEDRLLNPTNEGLRVGFVMYNMSNNVTEENYIVQGHCYCLEDEDELVSPNIIEVLLNGRDINE